MARSAQFNAGGFTFKAEIEKIDRKKVYGYTKLEVTDQHNNQCSLANITSDGMHILPSGCTGIMTLDSKGNYISRTSTKVVDEEGKQLSKVPSTFDGEVELQEVKNIEDYLDLNVKSIYQLNLTEGEASLIEKLQDGTMYRMLFNYRADYEGDDAFILMNEGAVFMVVGNKVEFEFIGYENSVAAVSVEEEDDDEDDDYDFSAL